MTDTRIIYLALSKRAAQLVRDACNHERFEREVTVTPDELTILRDVTVELDSQIGGLPPTPTPVAPKPRAQDIAEQMAAAGAAAVTRTKEPLA